MPIKTLLVDDETSLLEQSEIFLERGEEIEVSTVSSAEKALNLMDEEDFDVIVSDYQMPEMDGLEFLEEIREERENEIPFIMFTGKGREEVAMNALNLGADRYLQKGGGPEAQYEVLADAIKQEFEHKGTKEKIDELNSLLRSLSNVNRLIGEEDDLKTLMEKAAVELVETRNYQNMEISLLDRKDGKIKPVASSGVHPEREWEVTTDGSGDAPKCVKEVVKNPSTHLINDPEKYCTDCGYIDENEYHDTLLVPITHRSELTGIISACYKSGHDLSEDEVELLEGMGKNLGLAREKIIVENKLKESEEEFKNLTEVTSLPIAIYQDEYWVYANPAAIDICGYSLEELEEMKYWEFVAPEHREMLKKQVLEKEGSESGYEIKIITKEGKKKWVYLTESDIDYKDEPAGLISVIDINDRKKKEGEFQKTEEELKKNKKRRKLEDFAVEMESIDDEEKLYELTVDASNRILNFGICSLDIVEDGELEVKATIGGVREKGTRYPIEGLAGKSYRKGESLLIRDIEEEEDAKTKRESYRSAMSVPIGDFGVFMVWSEQKGDFDENDLELAETLVHHTKLVLNRIKGEEKLRKSEEKYRTIFESANDAIFILKKDRIVDCNEKTLELFGCDRDDIIGETPYEFSPEKQPDGRESKEKAMEKINSALEGEPQNFEWVHATKEGEPFHTKVTLNRYMVDDERFVMAIVRDISERKEYLEELKRKEEYIDHTPEFINIVDEKGEIKYQSSPSHGVEGIDPSKVTGSKGVEFVHPDDREEFQKMFSKVLENPGEEYRTELRGETKDGWTWFEVRAINHLDDPKIDGIIVTSRDISERKEKEERLRKERKKFSKIFNNANDAIYLHELTEEGMPGRFIDVNDTAVEMLGYRREEFLEMSTVEIDAEEKADEVPEVMSELTDEGEVKFEMMHQAKDGTEIPVEIQSHLFELEGKKRILSIARDITDRKEFERKLTESERKFRRVFEASPDPTFLLDKEGVFTDVNDTALKKLGYDKEEIVGKELEELPFLGEEAVEKTVENFLKRMDGEEVPPYEIEMISKDGDIVDAEINAKTFMEEEFKGEVVIARDITERKETEEKLRESERRFDLALRGAEAGVWDWNVKTDEVRYSEQWAEMLGYSYEEIDHNLDSWEKRVHPDERSWVKEELQKHLDGERDIFKTEHRMKTKSGDWIWVKDVGKVFERDENGEPLRATGILEDITDRKKAEERIKENKVKIERLHEISAEIQTCDSEEEVYSLSVEAAEDILDFDICSFDAVEGNMFVPKEISSSTPESGSTERQMDERSLGSKTYLNQESYLIDDLSSDKDAKPVKSDYRSAISVPIGENGVFQAVSTEVDHFDEEDLKTAELLVSHVSQALERIQAKDREKFLHSLLRHDVGNKNQIVRGYLELMKDHDIPEELEDLLDKAESAAKDSTEIIEKVRKLREIEEEEEIGEVDLSSVMNKVLSVHEDQLEEKGINIDVDVSDYKVKGGELLKEMFSNLVENSIHHAECDKIKISSEAEEDECVVTVEDDGVGISDEKKDKIFEKGFKEGESAGTGLGLYMVKEIAESYGGNVEVKDSEMGGARFEIHLQLLQK